MSPHTRNQCRHHHYLQHWPQYQLGAREMADKKIMFCPTPHSMRTRRYTRLRRYLQFQFPKLQQYKPNQQFDCFGNSICGSRSVLSATHGRYLAGSGKVFWGAGIVLGLWAFQSVAEGREGYQLCGLPQAMYTTRQGWSKGEVGKEVALCGGILF